MTLEGHLPVYLWGAIESPYLLPRKFTRLDFRLQAVWVHMGLCSCDVRTSVCLIDPYADCCSAIVRYSSTAVHRYLCIALLQQYMCITLVLLHILLYFSTAILYCCTYKDYSIAVLLFLEAAMLWCVCKSCDISAGVLAAAATE